MKFPDNIDNTMRTSFATCGEQFRYAHIECIAPNDKSVHTHFGGCFATGLEVARRAYYGEKQPVAEAMIRGVAAALAQWGDFDPGESSYKTKNTLRDGLFYYWKQWPLDTDTCPPVLNSAGQPDVEWWFRLPIPDVIHPEHGGPIYYTGRSDYIATMKGLIGIEDDKTATSLGESWKNQWDLDSQFSGYAWARHQMTGEWPDFILVRGVSILKPKFKEYIDKNGTEVNKKGQAVRYEYDMDKSFGHDQALVYRPEWMVKRWLAQLQRDVRRMVHAYLNNEWDLALHKGACEAYGGCAYKPLCMSEDPQKWIPVNFVPRKWDPLAHV